MPTFQSVQTSDYRESYANSIGLHGSLWDFFLVFGRSYPTAPDTVTIQNFEGIYISPPQAKAFLAILREHVAKYEAAFGEIKTEAATPLVGGTQGSVN